MKAAIIGCGVIGHVHAEILPAYAELCAVCDKDEAKMDAFPNARHYTDYEAMLEEVVPDVVHICTPHYLHTEMILACLNRNIHVLCEKPLCINEEDIPKILQAEKTSSAQLGICLQNRYNHSSLAVKEHLNGQTAVAGIGHMSWHRDAAYYASGDWRGKWATEGGGVLINQALHTLDLMQWFCGMPEELTASVSNLTLHNDIEVEDTATLICPNFNLYASIGTGFNFPAEITLRTNREWIRMTPHYAVIGDQIETFPDQKAFFGKECYGTGHEALIADYYSCIQSGRKFAIDGAEGAKVIHLILAAYRSQGEKVKV